jgi:RNA-binding protein YlmH
LPGDIGDILEVNDEEMRLVTTPEVAPIIIDKLKTINSVPIESQLINLRELQVKASGRKEINAIEASLRLDSVASAGYSMSRSKMVKYIEKGAVSVNWREAKNSSSNVRVSSSYFTNRGLEWLIRLIVDDEVLRLDLAICDQCFFFIVQFIAFDFLLQQL